MNCHFQGNSASGGGGAIYGYENASFFIDSTFIGNRGNSSGGAICVLRQTARISNCLFHENSSNNGWGGALQFFLRGSSKLDIEGSIFSENSAHQGGAIHGEEDGNGSARISNTLFLNNTAREWGGGIHLLSSSGAGIQLANCRFTGNSAGALGGAIFGAFSTQTVTNSVFLNNTAGQYGGGINNSGNLTLLNSSFTGNRAGISGGGLHNYQNATVKNCIFWDDHAPSEPELSNLGASLIVGYSDVRGGQVGTANIDADPRFVHGPAFWDATTAAGGLDAITVADAARYSVGETVEIGNDGEARRVVSAAGATVTFTPALAAPTTAGTMVGNWGLGVELVGEDLRLRHDSPARDTAYAVGAPNHDMAYHQRPAGAGYDMGAYEQGSDGAYARTIAIDGNKDFLFSERFSASTGGYAGYVAWDADYLYLGMEGADVGSNDPDKWVLAYIGTGSGTRSGVTYGAQQPLLPFDAGYHVRWKADNSYINLQVNSGTGWTDGGWPGSHGHSGTYLELRLPLSALGSPTKVQVHMNLLRESGNGWSWASVPLLSFSDGADPDYGQYLEFDLTANMVPIGYGSLP